MKLKLILAFSLGCIITLTINYFLAKEKRFRYDNSFIESQIKKNEAKIASSKSFKYQLFYHEVYNDYVLRSDSIMSSGISSKNLGEAFYKIIPSFLHFDENEVINLINNTKLEHSLNILRYSILLELLDNYRRNSVFYDAIYLKISHQNDTLRLGDYFTSDLSIGLIDFQYPYIGIVDNDTLPLSPMGLPIFSEKATHKGINKRKAKLLYNNWGMIDSLEMELKFYVE